MINRILSLPIRTHLSILVCLLIFPSIIIVIYSGLLEREQAIKDAQDNCMRFVNTLATGQQSMVVGAEQLTMALSMLPAIQSRNTGATNAILSDLPRKDLQYSIITVADEAGLVWASSTPFKGKVFITDRMYFQDVLRSGMFTSGEYVVGKITKKPILVFGSPIRNRENVLSGVMSIGLVFDYAQEASKKAKLPAGSSFSILDHKGIIIYTNLRHILPKELQGSRDIKEEIFTTMQQGPDEGTFTAVGNDGNVRLFAYKKLRLSHEREPYLYIRASITQAAAIAAATDKMYKYLSILGLVFVFGIFVSWLIGKRAIVDRIMMLGAAAQKLSEGAEHVNVSSVVQGGELGKLANVFDKMAVALSEREKALRESEENYRNLFDNANEAIFVAQDGKLVFINPMTTRMLGYSGEDLTSRSFVEFINAYDRGMVIDRHVRRTKGEELPHIYSFRIIRGDGKVIWAELNTVVVNWKGKPATLNFLSDITDRKQADEALKYAHDQLRALAIRLQEVREETKTTISQDLHDDVGGKLAGLKMDLLRLEGIVSKVNDVEQRNVLMELSHQTKELINNTILSARRIMMELRPSVLDDFGLVAALEWQVEEFKTHTDISCQFVVEQQKVDLEKHTATAIFRIFQEVLANAARHSGATEVIARLSSDKEMLVLEVTDNGRGITEQKISGRESLGLMGMKERALAIGGIIHVRGESEKGTSVALRVPMGRES